MTVRRRQVSELAEAVKPRRGPLVPTLSSIVQQKIVNDISHGRLPPGMRLEEEELARRYDVSRTPIREALRQLAAIGMVDIRHRQGVVVAVRSQKHVTNLLEVVADLEAASARYAAQRMTEAERDRLQALLEQMRAIAEQSAAARFDKANGQLHQLIHRRRAQRDPAQRRPADADADVPLYAARVHHRAASHADLAHGAQHHRARDHAA